jgi:TonB family protein
MSWVMGLVVLIAAAGASVWWIQDGRARFVQGYALNHAQVTTEGANVAPPRPNPQSNVESTPSAAAVPLKASRCNAEAEEQNVPLWNGYSLRLSPMKGQPDFGCMAVVMGAGEEEAWRKGSAAFEVVPVTGQDINGDRVPELVLEAFSGGAHCCWTYYILTLTPTPRVVSLENDGPVRFEPAPFGGYEMVTGDGNFAYFDGSSNAESPYPDVFLQLERSSFRNVSGNHWPTFQRKIDSARQRLTAESLTKFQASDGQHFDAAYNLEFRATKSAILTIVLEYLYGGRPQQAWREFESMWPESDQNRMRRLIEDTRAKGILGRTHAVQAELRSGTSLTQQPTSIATVPPPLLPSSLVALPSEVRSSITREPRSPVVLSEKVTERLLLSKVQPSYPPLAKQARISGAVVLKAVIGKDGSIKDLQALSGHPMLIQAATDAVRQWRYKPYVLEGEPVEVDTQITVNFTLAGG